MNSSMMTAENSHVTHPIDAENMHNRILSASEFLIMEPQKPEFCVEGLVPEGTTILAGPSKVGKTLLVTDLAHKVFAGEDFMGRPIHKSAVLMYSLEDSWSQLKDRLMKQGHACADPINSPKYSISAPTYYDGLKEEIEKFIQENGRSLIILDTLQLIAPPKTGTVSDYSLYYTFLCDISKMARENHSSIILVHRTTKTPDENNPFNGILGASAIQGAIDAMIIITRNKKQLLAGKATLHFTGRDIPMDEIEMVFRKDSLTWVEATNILRDFSYRCKALTLLERLSTR